MTIREWFEKYTGHAPTYGDITEYGPDGSANVIADMTAHCKEFYPDIWDLPLGVWKDINPEKSVGMVAEHEYENTDKIICHSHSGGAHIDVISNERCDSDPDPNGVVLDVPSALFHYFDKADDYIGAVLGYRYWELQGHGGKDDWSVDYVGDDNACDDPDHACELAAECSEAWQCDIRVIEVVEVDGHSHTEEYEIHRYTRS